jgi:hypothetical protein
MKMETGIVITKGVCAAGGATLLSLSASLGQWANTDVSPSAIEWAMIAGGSVGAGLATVSAFLSSSFGNYIKSRTEIDINGQSAVDTLMKTK